MMQESYLGEPHDGVYALNRYVKRVSVRTEQKLQKQAIMQKAEFQALAPAEHERELTFRSGGSSGEPKFSYFTYDDYHAQMRLSGQGLVQAGLDVKTDRVMNLFYAGGLYGGFLSFFSILESIRAHQLPMAALTDQTEVARSIVLHRANTLIGMPSYILSLFQTNAQLLRDARVVKKIFYGGEHLQAAQAEWLKQEFGVELIKSAAYGSVDAGPLGYQCRFQEGSRHHLHTEAHDFEIVEIDRDAPALEGRLLVTTRLRGHQKIERYDLGDLVRKVEGECACGRRGLVVDLLGRHGDVFRVGASFFNYAQFSRLLSEKFNYSGEFQIILKPRNSNNREEMVFCLEESHLNSASEVLHRELLQTHHDLHAAVVDEGVLEFSLRLLGTQDFKRNPSSGKLVHIIDERIL
jgi:phenylacetate-coenzyme A ligase PaaK-like adenylate-forming protein